MKAQGLPITTVVLIVLAVAVLAVVAMFLFGGMSSGQASISIDQCQQMCYTINVLVQGKSICTTDPADLAKVGSLKNFCNGKCNEKITCSLPNINNGCGYDRSTKTKTCINCQNGAPSLVESC